MSGRQRFVRFTVAGAVFALEAQYVQGIQRASAVQAGSDEAGRFGWLVTRTGRRPVYDTAHFLHLPPTPEQRPGPVLVLEAMLGGALMVQQINQVLEVPDDQVFDLPAAALGPAGHLITRILVVDDILIPVLRPDLNSAGKTTAADLEKNAMPSAEIIPKSAAGNMTEASTVAANQPAPSARQGGLVTFSTDQTAPGQRAVRFGISLTALREVLEPVAMVPIHLPNSYFGGFIAWRGQPVPVLDLNRRLQLKRGQPSEQNRFLVLLTGRPDQTFAVAANSDIRILQTVADWQPAASKLPMDYYFVAGTYDTGEAILVIPDLVRVAFAEEMPVS